jgi:hypothetical protein
MLFRFPRLHEEANRQLREWQIEGEYSLYPHYESLRCRGFFEGDNLRDRLEQFIRKTFKRPSHYSLHGSISDIIVAGERVPVHKGDVAELTLEYYPEVGDEFTYQGILYRLEFGLDKVFHLEMDTNANKNGRQTFFNPHIDLRSPALHQIKSMKMIPNPYKKELLPLHITDSGIMP